MLQQFADAVPKEIWDLYRSIQRTVEALPERIQTDCFLFGCRMPRDMMVNELKPNCHAMCVALASYYPVTIRHGEVRYFDRAGKRRAQIHSWLLPAADATGLVVIDPWPTGIISGPLLQLRGKYGLLEYANEFAHDSGHLRYFASEQFQSEVTSLRQAIRRVLRRIEPQRWRKLRKKLPKEAQKTKSFCAACYPHHVPNDFNRKDLTPDVVPLHS